jgi:transposase
MNDFASMHEAPARRRGRVDVFGGPPKRRSCEEAEKARLVAASLEPGAVTAEIARREGIHPQLLYAWRRLAREGGLALRAEDAPMFAAVLAAPEPGPGTEAPAPEADDAAEVVIELGDLRLRLGPDVSPARVAALVAALRAAR